ncbi:MAG: hypothetical protein H6742_14795 [Alphaproteobacteria bacterium]|nr:hypothetical protein [Alphaproteobacteria bacterium]
MTLILLATTVLGPAAFASPSADEDLSAWSTRTGVALASVPETQARPFEDGGMVVAGKGTSLVLRLASSPRELLDDQVAPFAEVGVRAPEWTQVACTVSGEPTTCLTGVLQVAPGASMRLLAGTSPADGFTAACLDRKGDEHWPAPCAGVIGQ